MPLGVSVLLFTLGAQAQPAVDAPPPLPGAVAPPLSDVPAAAERAAPPSSDSRSDRTNGYARTDSQTRGVGRAALAPFLGLALGSGGALVGWPVGVAVGVLAGLMTVPASGCFRPDFCLAYVFLAGATGGAIGSGLLFAFGALAGALLAPEVFGTRRSVGGAALGTAAGALAGLAVGAKLWDGSANKTPALVVGAGLVVLGAVLGQEIGLAIASSRERHGLTLQPSLGLTPDGGASVGVQGRFRGL